MKYNIRINKVDNKDSQVKAFASVTFDDSLAVRNIAVVQRKDSDTLFVSMPSHRTSEVNEAGEPVYRDICNPINKEFYDEFTSAILAAYDKRAELGRDGYTVGDATQPLSYSVKVVPFDRSDSHLRALGRIYLGNDFVINNVKLIEGKKGLFISMPDYKTDRIKDDKPVYREIVFPVSKEFRESLYGSIEKSYEEAKSLQQTESQEMTMSTAQTQDAPVTDEPIPDEAMKAFR